MLLIHEFVCLEVLLSNMTFYHKAQNLQFAVQQIWFY